MPKNTVRISPDTPVEFLVPLYGLTPDTNSTSPDPALLELLFALMRQHAPNLLKAPPSAYAARPLPAPAPVDAPRMR